MQIMNFFRKTINLILFLVLFVIFTLLTWHLIPPFTKISPKKCSKNYSVIQNYNIIDTGHEWHIEKIPFKEITSYKKEIVDGINIYSDYDYNTITKENDLLSRVRYIKNGRYSGFSYGYYNEELSIVDQYSKNNKNGIELTFSKSYPSLLIVYSNDKSIGLVSFWDYGRIKEIKFGSQYKDETREDGKDNNTYDNSQKAFEYIEENDTEYWVVYNQKGQILIKYPKDNDFCKAEFYENGKKVEIPYYFDQKEFEEIYEKIKNDVNKSTI